MRRRHRSTWWRSPSPVVTDVDAIGRIFLASVERAPWGWGMFVTVIVALWRGWPAIIDASVRARMALGDRRLGRIEKLEQRIDQQRVSFEAEISILRHDLNNANTCLDLLLTLLEAQPEKAAEHAARIKAMMDRRARDLSAEKATIRAARIVGAGPSTEDAA